MDRKILLGRTLKWLIILGLLVFIYFQFSVFIPILLAFITALALEPLVQWFQKGLKTDKRLVPVSITFTLFVLAIGIVMHFTITYLVREAIKFIYRLPHYVVEITRFLEELIRDFNRAIADLPQKDLIIRELEQQSQLTLAKTQMLSQNAIPTIAEWIQSIPNMLIVTLIYLITLFLVSLDMPGIIHNFYSHFQENTRNKLHYIFTKLSRVFTGFLKAQVLISIVIFIVAYVGLLYITPKNALIMAIIIWIIDVIPLIGSIVILLPWSLYTLISGNTTMGLQLLILTIILLILRRTLEPKIMGDQIGLSALPTLLSLYFGFYFFGFLGMIIGPLVLIAIRSASEVGIIRTDFKI
ncbi:sporulation integral membrane protein YtvI [Ammoniphilus sp. YIM 78166]|uniref:sporulation integral membrane protein YtvI n=1 Tax=Ammoniphilus sp. YIM 78166 TaxID=1644106 RepID=UPI001F0D3B3A|nr:sporulation integral membrane protein YtvI [Ammoniphilus sp. YIM 78166]